MSLDARSKIQTASGTSADFIFDVGSLPEKHSEKLTIDDVHNVELDDDEYIIEIFVEENDVRVRTDGEDATGETGEPLAEGFSKKWTAENVSIYPEDTEAVITIVKR